MSLVRLSFELGMAVSDYNCGITNDHNAIISTTFMYLNKVKDAVLTEDELVECYAIIGQMWASVIERPLESDEDTKEPKADKETKEPAKEATKETKEATKEATKETKEATKETTKEATKETTKETTKEATKETTKETTKEPAKEAPKVKEPAKITPIKVVEGTIDAPKTLNLKAVSTLKCPI